MISKHDLQSVIGKYHLNGLVESVKWTIEDNALNIDFQSPNKDMIGRVNHANFPLENGEMAVYDTSKLNKLLGVTSGELFLEFPDDIMESLGWNEGDVLEWTYASDHLILKKQK